MLEDLPTGSYAQLIDAFRWRVPARFNIGVACADRHDPAALALVGIDPEGRAQSYTFGDLAQFSNRLANALRGRGTAASDRIAIVLPQRIETGVAHLAAYKLGAITVPLSPLFGHEALRFRIGDSGARVVVTDLRRLDVVVEAVADLTDVQILVVDEPSGGHPGFWEVARSASADFSPVPTAPDDPAMLIYTSGTTGPPKGALHGHRVVLGHLPGFELMFDSFPQSGDRSWTPADWAWAGGLLDLLLPSWFHGRPVVGTNRGGSFEPEWAEQVMRRYRVSATFLPPSALRMLRQSGTSMIGSSLRTVMSGGEALGAEMLAWSREHLGLEPNEIYGQTEANLVVGNSRHIWPIRPGSMGRPFPGHDVQVRSASGEAVGAGHVGQIVVRAPDPVCFLGYWNRPDATAEKVRDGWLHTGDLGRADDDGYLWFTARDDDIINSAGYRIGPGEIEECIASHPRVVNAAAIGVPDELRGQVVKAFVVLAPGCEPSPQSLEQEIRAMVRTRLATYEYPRDIEFIDELPMTTTGKVRRVALHAREKHRDHNGRQPSENPARGGQMNPGEIS